MPRVRSLSNHPYGGAMRPKGTEYDVTSESDADLLVQLKRVERVIEPATYSTREMQAAQPSAAPIMTTRGSRPARAAAKPDDEDNKP